MTPTQQLNALIEAFDRQTGYRYDRITDGRRLCRLAQCLRLRPGLADQLTAAFRVVQERTMAEKSRERRIR